jgi:hypothetical protein
MMHPRMEVIAEYYRQAVINCATALSMGNLRNPLLRVAR